MSNVVNWLLGLTAFASILYTLLQLTHVDVPFDDGGGVDALAGGDLPLHHVALPHSVAAVQTTKPSEHVVTDMSSNSRHSDAARRQDEREPPTLAATQRSGDVEVVRWWCYWNACAFGRVRCVLCCVL